MIYSNNQEIDCNLYVGKKFQHVYFSIKQVILFISYE